MGEGRVRAETAAPFAGLTPEAILAAVESLGLDCDGRVLALNSYENRVFRIGITDAAPLVAKFYRPGRWSDLAILEEHAFSAELAGADLSVVSPCAFDGRTLHHHAQARFSMFPMQGGHCPEPGDRDTLRQIGTTLGRMHALGSVRRFQHRVDMSMQAMAVDSAGYLLDAQWLPAALEENFEALCHQVIDRIEAAWASVETPRSLRLHGDCHPGNILWRAGSAHFVDLDDACNGPAIQDLWMLCTGSREERRQQLQWLLDGYETFHPFDRRELHLIEALRAMRLLHYHAWIARRWHDPAFPAAFPWFDSPRHWEQVIVQIQEQLWELDEPALSLGPG